MPGKTGKGREPGSRNKRTIALLELAEAGETPCAFALRIMRDESQGPLMQLTAAKMAAPYIHPRPQPEPRIITMALPADVETAAGLLAAHTSVLSATASGNLSLEEAEDLSGILETQRRLVETINLETRIAALEKEITK